MTALVLAIVITLGFWALYLMEQAYERQEFSRMLAGMLVVFAAGGVLTTYFIMSDYINYMVTVHDYQSVEALSISQSGILDISTDWVPATDLSS